MLIVVNRGANSGKGAERWERVARALEAGGVAHEARVTASAAEGEEAVRAAIAGRHDAVIAAGGDGTVNSVLNALMDPRRDQPRADLALGAIGLGSSNDFHKPFAPARTLAKTPVRLKPGETTVVDIGRALLTSADGTPRTRYFLLNASMGFVAAGNAFFNTDDKRLVWCKRRNVELAILYTVWRSLRTFRPVEVSLQLDDEPARQVPLTALSILKKTYLAGGMRYDTPVTADDGHFDVNIWEPMGAWGILGTMAGLYRGKFSGRKRTQVWRARRVRIRTETPLDFELDGEVTQIVAADVQVLPRRLKLCG